LLTNDGAKGFTRLSTRSILGVTRLHALIGGFVNWPSNRPFFEAAKLVGANLVNSWGFWVLNGWVFARFGIFENRRFKAFSMLGAMLVLPRVN